MKANHFLLILCINVAWGFNFVAAKTALDYFPPFLMLLLRFSLIFIVLLPFIKVPMEKLSKIVLIAFISGVLYFSLNFIGLKYSGELASASIATQMFVPFATILAVIFLKEKIGWKRIFAISIAFSGIIIVSFEPQVFENLYAFILIVFSSIPMAITVILMRKLKGVHPFQIQAWTGIVSIICYLLLTLIFEENQLRLILDAPILAMGGVIYAAFIASLVGHGALYYLLARYPVTVVNPLLLISPIFATLFGFIFLGDQLTYQILIGGSVSLVGITIIALRTKDINIK